MKKVKEKKVVTEQTNPSDEDIIDAICQLLSSSIESEKTHKLVLELNIYVLFDFRLF